MKKNPLLGKVFFDEEGNLLMERGIKFGGQMKPKVRPREWFYLVWEACKAHGLPKKNLDDIVKSWLGSPTTQWRTRNALLDKGYDV